MKPTQKSSDYLRELAKLTESPTLAKKIRDLAAERDLILNHYRQLASLNMLGSNRMNGSSKMTKHTNRSTLRQPVDTTLIEYIQWALKNSSLSPHRVQAGLHYSVISMSVVFFEAAIFTLLEQLSSGVRGSNIDDSPIVNNIAEKLIKDCYRTTGLASYCELFETLTTHNLAELLGPRWEGLKMLFALRNHLVHGRSRILDLQWEENEAPVARHLNSLDKVENYLKKAGLLENIPTHRVHFSDYLSLETAQWAWDTVKYSVLAVAETRKGHSRIFFSYLNSIEGISYKTEVGD